MLLPLEQLKQDYGTDGVSMLCKVWRTKIEDCAEFTEQDHELMVGLLEALSLILK